MKTKILNERAKVWHKITGTGHKIYESISRIKLVMLIALAISLSQVTAGEFQVREEEECPPMLYMTKHEEECALMQYMSKEQRPLVQYMGKYKEECPLFKYILKDEEESTRMQYMSKEECPRMEYMAKYEDECNSLQNTTKYKEECARMQYMAKDKEECPRMQYTSKYEEECVRVQYMSKYEEVLRVSADLDNWSYLAFPAVLQISPSTVLISYKRGMSHGGDPGAKLEMMRLNVRSGKVVETKILGEQEDLIFQMGEWVKFPNGNIANYVDVQKIVPTPGYRNNHRTGVYYTRSRDGGNSFSPMQKMGPVDGVEYGYAFEDVTVGSRVYMLVMTFPELVGKIGEEGWKYGKVHVIVSGDNGGTWSHVRNLSKEFGDIDINESSFVWLGDKFMVTTRGYDNQERLHLTTEKFELITQVNITEKYSCVKNKIGRPRLFKREGEIYLLGRNYTDPVSLSLHKINPATLELQTYTILDQRPGDAYYAESFFIDKKGKTFFNVITYVKSTGNFPDIVRFEFPWEQICGTSSSRQ